jgi:SPP1 family predicted phage head-tail adaptor
VSDGFDAGRLRHRVTIERPVGTPDGAGGETVTWETLAAAWAEVRPLTAAEKTVAGHAAAVLTHRVTLRQRDGIAGGMRIVHRGRLLQIRAVRDPDEAGRWLVAECGEEAA